MAISTLIAVSVTLVSIATQAQEHAIDINTEKANVILQQVAEAYANAESIQIEAIEEQNHNSPLASDWLKTYLYLNRGLCCNLHNQRA